MPLKRESQNHNRDWTGPRLAVISKKTDTLELVDFDSMLATICSSFLTPSHRQHGSRSPRETGEDWEGKEETQT